MNTDLKAYDLHIQMLETINIIIYAGIVIATTLISLIIFKKFFFAFIGLLIGILVGYFIYAIGQLKADQHRIQIDIYKAIKEKSN